MSTNIDIPLVITFITIAALTTIWLVIRWNSVMDARTDARRRNPRYQSTGKAHARRVK